MEPTLETYRLHEPDDILTPALLLYPEQVQANIQAAIRMMGGDANRWRPHIKTVKSPDVIGMLLAACVRAFKCATTRELAMCLTAGAPDVVFAMPVSARSARRVGEIARQHKDARVSVLVEDDAQLEFALGQGVGIFVDVNPGMNRTGVDPHRADVVRRLAQAAGGQFRGLHFYDGHISGSMQDRERQAHAGYRELMNLINGLGVALEEVITSGTPALPAALSFSEFKSGAFQHRVSPGTIVFNDVNSLGQLPDFGFAPSVLVLATVVSHPTAGVITCDAGHKAVCVDSGVPNCRVLGYPELEPLKPSEEHLPIRVPEGSRTPQLGELLYLLPKHVCPTVNMFDEAITVGQGKVDGLWKIAARGHELRTS